MKKEEFIRVRVAGWQKKYISLQAEKAHKSLSQYVRDAAMDKDVTVIDGVDDLIRELRRQGNNLNQLVVMARQGHVELVNMEPFMEVYDCILDPVLFDGFSFAAQLPFCAAALVVVIHNASAAPSTFAGHQPPAITTKQLCSKQVFFLCFRSCRSFFVCCHTHLHPFK